MKKFLTITATLLFALIVMAQNPVITFDKTTHDFGKFNEADGRVTTIFTFKNEGMTPLVVSNVRASCGCTTPKWTREPIEPGQTGELTVTYNPNGRPGRFQKTVTVTSNATEPTTRLYIKGEVIPKPVKPVNKYPVTMGELSLQKKSIHFGTIIKGSNKMLEIEYANLTEQPITIDVLLSDEHSYIKPNVTLKTVAPGQTGKLQFAIQSEECPEYGPINVKAYVTVNGKRDISEASAITISANIKEDFSQLTVEQRQQAPIVDVLKEVHLGTVIPGKKHMSKITITNAGINPLVIRRVIINDQHINCIAPKAAIKAGRKADIKLELDANIKSNPAQYSRILTLITNDPKNPVVNIKLNWVIK